MEKSVYTSNQFLDKLNDRRKNKVQNLKRNLKDEYYNFGCRVQTLRKR